MGNEECGFLPDKRQQFVQIVRCRRAVARVDTVGRIDRSQQTEFLIVDQFPLLTFLDAFDRKTQLFFKLVVRIVIQVAHTGMNTNHRLQGVQVIFRRVLFVINVGLRDGVVLFMSGKQINMLFAMIVHRCFQTELLIDRLIECFAEVGHFFDELLQILQSQA